MIFVTVGTHEQQFDRLISCVDTLKGEGIIQEDVFIQTGFSTYEPRHCRWSKLIPYSEMVKNVAEARIVITHGGPASFIMPLQLGKIPIVVPRQLRFGEHVNDHQVEFCKEVAQRFHNIFLALDTQELTTLLKEYDTQAREMGSAMHSNNQCFNDSLKQIISDLF